MRKHLNIFISLLLGLFLLTHGYSQKAGDFKVSPNGLRYKLYKSGKDTTKPGLGDWVSILMRYSTIIKGKDTLLFDSKTQLKGAPVRFQLPPSDFRGDLYEGLGMLSAGDSALFVINADSLFLRTFRMEKRPDVIDKNADVFFYVYLLSFDNPEKLINNELTALQKFISDNKIAETPTASGIYIINSQKGEGIKMDTGCMVKLQMKVSLIDGKQLFSSYDRPEPLKFTCGNKFDTPGLEEALMKMKKGEKSRVIVPSKMGFGEKGKGVVIPPYTTIVYDVEILDILSKEASEKERAAAKAQETKMSDQKSETVKNDEAMLLENYLKENKITVKPNASGLYYIEKSAGTGPQAVAGKKVKVHYTGTLLNGKKFDSSVDRNEPFEFDLGIGQVIKGWDEGIALMKVGGKATLIIPSTIAYGSRDMGVIPPFSTLVFDVELIDVK